MKKWIVCQEGGGVWEFTSCSIVEPEPEPKPIPEEYYDEPISADEMYVSPFDIE